MSKIVDIRIQSRYTNCIHADTEISVYDTEICL